ncbi:excisionase family DNA-binding protein [Candidatus Poribacteria bacterium]|nr:excisionase family DNA-binding protein [Candidatus Poribacteria bacterium]
MLYVSTGKAARLLSVTPDAVLKWIKAGKLEARKTAGGHYRISLDSVQSLLKGEEASRNERGPHQKKRLVPCWEYNSIEGKIKDQCSSCLVFKAKGSKCYEVGKILKERGQGATCCPTKCEECSYYKEQGHRPISVLVHTGDSSLKGSLAKEPSPPRIRLRFTTSEYDCSVTVDCFRPEYVILDCKGKSAKCDNLCERLANDPRIPGVRIFLLLPPGMTCKTSMQENISIIERPKSVADVESLLDRIESSE